MSTQTKYFIEPSDIVAVRFECQNCHATVSLLVQKNMRLGQLLSCVNCNEPWLALPGGGIETNVRECIQAIERMSDILGSWEKSLKAANRVGFSLSMEVTKPPESI